MTNLSLPIRTAIIKFALLLGIITLGVFVAHELNPVREHFNFYAQWPYEALDSDAEYYGFIQNLRQGEALYGDWRSGDFRISYPPLLYHLIGWVHDLFGEGFPIARRFNLSLLTFFWILGLALSWRLGKKLQTNSWTPLYVVLLFSWIFWIQPTHLMASTIGFNPELLFAVLSAIAISLWLTVPSTLGIFLALIFSTLALMTKQSGLFTLGWLGIWTLRPKNWKPILAAFTFGITLLLTLENRHAWQMSDSVWIAMNRILTPSFFSWTNAWQSLRTYFLDNPSQVILGIFSGGLFLYRAFLKKLDRLDFTLGYFLALTFYLARNGGGSSLYWLLTNWLFAIATARAWAAFYLDTWSSRSKFLAVPITLAITLSIVFIQEWRRFRFETPPGTFMSKIPALYSYVERFRTRNPQARFLFDRFAGAALQAGGKIEFDTGALGIAGLAKAFPFDSLSSRIRKQEFDLITAQSFYQIPELRAAIDATYCEIPPLHRDLFINEKYQRTALIPCGKSEPN